MHIAHGSVAEVQSQLYVALDLDYINKAGFDKIYSMSDEISRPAAQPSSCKPQKAQRTLD
ncbi:MAG: four helix bundle protein [Elusimicrobia bacterium]|nr:four helix bundle protein [Elusimicrobiota bacterium]